MTQSCERFRRTACPQKWPPIMLAGGVSESTALIGCTAQRGQRSIDIHFEESDCTEALSLSVCFTVCLSQQFDLFMLIALLLQM